MKRKRNIPKKVEIQNVNFFSWNEICILMKLDEMANQVQPLHTLLCLGIFSNCPWHLSSRFLPCCNILHDERILDIFVSIIGKERGKCQAGWHGKYLCGLYCIFHGNFNLHFKAKYFRFYITTFYILWKYILNVMETQSSQSLRQATHTIKEKGELLLQPI